MSSSGGGADGTDFAASSLQHRWPAEVLSFFHPGVLGMHTSETTESPAPDTLTSWLADTSPSRVRLSRLYARGFSLGRLFTQPSFPELRNLRGGVAYFKLPAALRMVGTSSCFAAAAWHGHTLEISSSGELWTVESGARGLGQRAGSCRRGRTGASLNACLILHRPERKKLERTCPGTVLRPRGEVHLKLTTIYFAMLL